MLQLRSAQIQAFADQLTGNFVSRMVAMLRSDFATELDRLGIKNERTAEFVRSGLEAAKLYDITGEEDLEYFVRIMCVLGYGFEKDARYPWAGECLRRKDLSGTEKMDLLHNHLLFLAGGE